MSFPCEPGGGRGDRMGGCIGGALPVRPRGWDAVGGGEYPGGHAVVMRK